MNRVVLIAGAIILGAVATGCSQAAEPVSPTALSQQDEKVDRTRFECLKARGWPVEYHAGAIVIDVPDEQRVRYREDADACLRAAGVDPDAPVSEAQYAQVYSSYTGIQRCLERAGWSTPARPALEDFIATYESEPWIPWSEVPGASLPRAGEACPAMRGGAG